MPTTIESFVARNCNPGGSVKRSLAMAVLECSGTIAKACGLDAATQ